MKKKIDFLGHVLEQLRSVKHSDLKQVGLGSGVPEGTLRKLYYGEVANPRVQTVQALHDYFLITASLPPTGIAPKDDVLPGRIRPGKVDIRRSTDAQLDRKNLTTPTLLAKRKSVD